MVDYNRLEQFQGGKQRDENPPAKTERVGREGQEYAGQQEEYQQTQEAVISSIEGLKQKLLEVDAQIQEMQTYRSQLQSHLQVAGQQMMESGQMQSMHQEQALGSTVGPDVQITPEAATAFAQQSQPIEPMPAPEPVQQLPMAPVPMVPPAGIAPGP